MILHAYSTLSTCSPPPFAPNAQARGLVRPDGTLDPDMEQHLAGFQGWVFQAFDETYDERSVPVLEHLQHTKWQYAFELDPADFRAALAWAGEVNALMMREEGFVIEPSGDAVCPPSIPRGNVPYTAEARERAATQRAFIAGRRYPVSTRMAPSRGTTEAVPHTADEVAAQLVERLAVARAGGPEGPSATVDALTLAWCLGLAPLTWPDAVPPATALDALPAPEQIAAAPRLRPLGEIIDEQERMRCLVWLTRKAKSEGKAPPTGFHPELVSRRAAAVTWVTDVRQRSFAGTNVET